jgi:hypothetical protein
MEKFQWQMQVAVIHTGDDMGFAQGGLLTSKAKSMKDHHREMDGRKSEGWFVKVLPCLEVNMVSHGKCTVPCGYGGQHIKPIWKETRPGFVNPIMHPTSITHKLILGSIPQHPYCLHATSIKSIR